MILYFSDIASIQTDSCKLSNCVIASTGQVSCIPPCLHTARCAAEFSTWPFDTQNCSLHIGTPLGSNIYSFHYWNLSLYIGTWINAADEVDFKVSKTVIPESDLQSQNKLWKMLKVTYMRNHGNFSSTTKRYVRSVFEKRFEIEFSLKVSIRCVLVFARTTFLRASSCIFSASDE